MMKTKSIKCLRCVIGVALFYLFCFNILHNLRSSLFLNDDRSTASSALGSALEDFKGNNVENELDSTHESKREKAGHVPVLPDDKIAENSDVLGRDFSRIPGYIRGSNNSSLFGYVMRDLSNRFLLPSSDQQQRKRRNRNRNEDRLRQLSSSNILVVSPGASNYLSDIVGKKKHTTTVASKWDLIKSFGYKIAPSFLVDSVYYRHNVIGVDSDTGMTIEYNSNSETTTTTTNYSKPNTTDILLAIFDPEQGQEDSAIPAALEAHIRSGSIEFAIFRVAISVGGRTRVRGMVPSKIFLDAGYKLQVLSSSHSPTLQLNAYGPNTLLKDLKRVKQLLVHGLAQSLVSKTSSLTRGSKNTTNHGKAVFHSILFATRGLDLAIPSRTAFLSFENPDNFQVLNVQRVPYLSCYDGKRKSGMTIDFREVDSDYGHVEINCFGIAVSMREGGSSVLEKEGGSVVVEFWLSHANLSLSEAACVTCTEIKPKRTNLTLAECKTRILPSENFSRKPSSHGNTAKGGPNLLAIELKGVNQNMLNLSMPTFKESLTNLGIHFVPDYVASPELKKFSNASWWEAASADKNSISVYNRYRGSNGCSRFARSSDEPVLHHGGQVGEMFCFDYDRPNCLHGEHAATHIFNHLAKFIKVKLIEGERWAAYVTVVEGEEETETLAGTLTHPFRSFLSNLKSQMSSEQWSNTIIIIYSDDVKDPVLFLKADRNIDILELKKRSNLTTLALNNVMKLMMTTKNIEKMREVFGSHLTSVFAGTNVDSSLPGVLQKYEFKTKDTVAPPSILSFYADIPKEQKFQHITPPTTIPANRATVVRGCKCATPKKKAMSWFQCDEHPWEKGASYVRPAKENYILVDCPDQPLHLEIDLVQDRNLIRRSERKRRESGLAESDNINIIFLELDSVSLEYANRHFPKTRELLKKYRINRIHKDDFACPSGICSAEFPHTSLVGANSIPNQVAALSGCLSTTTEELCGISDPSIGDICNDPDVMHDGFLLQRIRPTSKEAYWCPNRALKTTKTPWILGVSDSKGYINFFGEEFCYEFSPYVTQGNVFPTFYADIQSHSVFCSLAERKALMENLPFKLKERWGVDINDPCIEGNSCTKKFEKSTISLQFIEQMWDKYPKQPKMAFLNVMAAHDYSSEWELMIPKAEAYDEHLFEFLQNMISRKDFQQTVIFVRSDHGLQKGPMAADYALQVEHRHPWTEILIPERLVLSKSALFHNQARMLTGFDLYHTMRLLMTDRDGSGNSEGGIPPWSFDILTEEIPQNRSCEDSKVDPDLCRKVNPKRNFGVCNYLDASQAPFCPRTQNVNSNASTRDREEGNARA